MSDRKALMMGNWKMHANHLEAIQMVQKLSYRLESADFEQVDLVVAPPFTALRSVQLLIDTDKMRLGLGAQNVDWHSEGAFTGEISAAMLAKLDVSHVIVGHSERRQHFGDTDEIVAKKVKAVLESEMTPVLCVGESLEQREAGQAESHVVGQVNAALKGVDPTSVSGVVVAYEPIWAIGTGRNALPEDAALMAGIIRETILEMSTSEISGKVRILYGGSVNPGNIKELMAKEHIDGALVGGASLDPDKMAAIVRYRI